MEWALDMAGCVPQGCGTQAYREVFTAAPDMTGSRFAAVSKIARCRKTSLVSSENLLVRSRNQSIDLSF